MAKAIHSMIRVLDETRSVEFYKTAFGRRVDHEVGSRSLLPEGRVRVVVGIPVDLDGFRPLRQLLLLMSHGTGPRAAARGTG